MGIFPYVLKLLQSSARELRPLLVFIWAKILAVDSVSNPFHPHRWEATFRPWALSCLTLPQVLGGAGHSCVSPALPNLYA